MHQSLIGAFCGVYFDRLLIIVSEFVVNDMIPVDAQVGANATSNKTKKVAKSATLDRATPHHKAP